MSPRRGRRGVDSPDLVNRTPASQSATFSARLFPLPEPTQGKTTAAPPRRRLHFFPHRDRDH